MDGAIATVDNQYPTVVLKEIAQPISRPVDVVPGNSYRTMGVKWWGEGAYERETIDGSRTAARTLSVIRTNDLVINKIWVRHGSTAVAGKNVDGCAVSGEFPTYELDTTKVLPEWIHWQTKTKQFWDKCASLSQGTSGKNRIKPELFLTIKIPLPPIEEQRRVVARIEELVAKVEEARGLRSEAIEEVEALSIAAASRYLSSVIVDSSLGRFLLEKPRNGWSARCDNLETGVPVLSLGAVTGFNYRETEFKRTSEPILSDAHYWVEKGDLLITRSNSPELVGHAAIYDGSPSPCIYPDLMMKLVINEEYVDKQFVHHWLKSRLVRDYIAASAKGTSPTMKKISQEIVMNIPFPSTISIIEQRRIVACLDDIQATINRLKQLQAETAQELNAMLPSILDKALRGSL